MEVMVGAAETKEAQILRHFLNRFRLLDIDANVSELAVQLRQRHRLRLPDAIIWATARAHNALLVTRNTRDFDRNEPGIRIPYIP